MVALLWLLACLSLLVPVLEQWTSSKYTIQNLLLTKIFIYTLKYRLTRNRTLPFWVTWLDEKWIQICNTYKKELEIILQSSKYFTNRHSMFKQKINHCHSENNKHMIIYLTEKIIFSLHRFSPQIMPFVVNSCKSSKRKLRMLHGLHKNTTEGPSS